MSKIIKGGEFIVSATTDIFTPEQFNDEQKMIVDMCEQFLDTEVLCKLGEIDNQEDGLMSSIMDKAGELGLLGMSIPEEYGGFGKDLVTSILTTECIGKGHSFAVAWAAHTGIGTLPILYFGTDEQRLKYIPKLSSGEYKGAYCLTEPGSGSDALAARTTAVLSDDKTHYILNGQKMWITNAGFADVFTVFAKIEGQFTGFIVERSFPGISFGEEEHKMGIKGSSTRQVFFTDCIVPVENLLGKIGKGHKIAFNILNIGRLKLAAATLGGSKSAINHSLKYANERQQFGTSIGNFGAIKHKLSEQAIRTWVLETALYRASDNIQDWINVKLDSGLPYHSAKMNGAEQYAIECAMLKVFGSETLDYVVDESVQIFGGYGFSSDYPVDRGYRDSRINRIFEGTNEINRLLMVDMIMKKALRGELDLMTPAMKVQAEMMSIPDFSESDEPFFLEKESIIKLKKCLFLVAGYAMKKFGKKLSSEQEIVMNISDIAINIYMAESALIRAEKTGNDHHINIARIFLHDSIDNCSKISRDAVLSMTIEGDEQLMLIMGIKRFTKPYKINVKDVRRSIADLLLSNNKYNI